MTWNSVYQHCIDWSPHVDTTARQVLLVLFRDSVIRDLFTPHTGGGVGRSPHPSRWQGYASHVQVLCLSTQPLFLARRQTPKLANIVKPKILYKNCPLSWNETEIKLKRNWDKTYSALVSVKSNYSYWMSYFRQDVTRYYSRNYSKK